MQKGVLVVNYVGHGGEVGWAHERFLDNTTILSWTNLERLPLFMTATCEFSRWDDPARTSAGEYVLLNRKWWGHCPDDHHPDRLFHAELRAEPVLL